MFAQVRILGDPYNARPLFRFVSPAVDALFALWARTTAEHQNDSVHPVNCSQHACFSGCSVGET